MCERAQLQLQSRQLTAGEQSEGEEFQDAKDKVRLQSHTRGT